MIFVMLHAMLEVDCILTIRGRKYYKEKFSLVEPVTLYLGVDAHGKKAVCQYVPIKLTLSSLVKNARISEQVHNSFYYTNLFSVVWQVELF